MKPREAPVLDSPDVVVDLECDSPMLVVAFGSLLGRLGGVPHFEFMQIMSRVSVKCAFVRDTGALWYHGGVAGVGATVDDLAAALMDLAELAEAERTVFIGASSGGYAAILFACLTLADKALAFSPQTFLSPEQRAAAGDDRWPEQTSRLAPELDPRYADLRPVLDRRCGSGAAPHVAIHFSAGNPLDSAHAEHLAHSPCVELVTYEGGYHGLPGRLKQQGRLEEILCEAIGPVSGA